MYSVTRIWELMFQDPNSITVNMNTDKGFKRCKRASTREGICQCSCTYGRLRTASHALNNRHVTVSQSQKKYNYT